MSSLTSLSVKPLDRFNWTDFLDLKISDSQAEFVPSVLHSIAESKFESCVPMGIWLEGEAVGFVQHCVFNRTCWISRVIVDERFQRQGIGKEAVKRVLAQLGPHQCAEIRTSFHPRNEGARALFLSLGFEPYSSDAWEEVYRLP